MTEWEPLRAAILELGLEDWIPLPQISGVEEVRDALGRPGRVEEIADALRDLLRAGRIQIWRGPWEEEPKPVGMDVAEVLISDRRRYSYDGERHGLDRTYFVNVENIRT